MTDIITLPDYKSYKGLTKDTEDVSLSIIVSAVNNLIKAYLNRPIGLADDENIVEYVNLDYGTNVIFPNNWPISEVVSITEIPYGYTYDSTVHFPLNYNTEYTVAGDRIYKTNGYWRQGPQAVRLEYRAGFQDIPGDLRLAALELVDYYHKNEYMQSRVAGNTTITNVVTGNAELPPHVRVILDNYKN